jgi:hypothetical protein
MEGSASKLDGAGAFLRMWTAISDGAGGALRPPLERIRF